MRWRPQGGTHRWSDAQPLPTLLQLGSKGNAAPPKAVVCAPLLPSVAPFRMAHSATKGAVTLAKGDGDPTLRGSGGGGGGGGGRGRAHRQQVERQSVRATWNITLRAPLVVENLLPCPTHIWLTTAKGSITLDAHVAEVVPSL